MTNIIAIVLAAILQVESQGGTDKRHGDNGKAVGPYQLHTEAVREANRIDAIYARRYKRKARRWTYSDRNSMKKSREIAELILIRFYRMGITDPVTLGCRHRNPYSQDNAEYRRKIKREIGN